MNDAFPVPVEFLGLKNPGKIGMHANCGTHSLIVHLREQMKKANVAEKRRKRRVVGDLMEEEGEKGKRDVDRSSLNFGCKKESYVYIPAFALKI